MVFFLDNEQRPIEPITVLYLFFIPEENTVQWYTIEWMKTVF